MPPSDIVFGPESIDVTAATVNLGHVDTGNAEGPQLRADRFGFAPESGSRTIDVNPDAGRIRLSTGGGGRGRIDIDPTAGGITLRHQSLSIRDDDAEVNRFGVSGSDLGGGGWGHTMTVRNPEGDEEAVLDTSTRTGPELSLVQDGEEPLSEDGTVGSTLELRTREHGRIVAETTTDDTATIRLRNSSGAGAYISGGGQFDGTVGVFDGRGDARVGLFAASGDRRSAVRVLSPGGGGGIAAAQGGIPVASMDETGLLALGDGGEHGRVRLADEEGNARVQVTAGHPGQVDVREGTTGVFANGRTGNLVLSGTGGQLTIERGDRIAAALTSNADLDLGVGTTRDPGAPGSVTVRTTEGAEATTIQGREATLTVGPRGSRRQGPVKSGSSRVVEGGRPGTVSVRDEEGTERARVSADTDGTGSDPGVVTLRNSRGDAVCHVRVNGDAVEFVDAASSGQPVVFRIQNGRVEAPNQSDV